MSAAPRYILDGTTVGTSRGAHDAHLQRDVLLKPWWSAADRDALRRIIASVAGLQNKHIADVYDLVEMNPGNGLAIVEERLTGSDLATWDSSTSRNEGEVLRVLLQMTGAVAALHSYGLSAPSLEAGHWRFDADGLLNLSVFVASPSGRGGVIPLQLTEARRAEDVRYLAAYAKQRATRHFAGPTIVPALSDPMLRELWQGAPSGAYALDAYHQRLHACVVRDQHRAMVVYRQRPMELSAKNRALTLTHPAEGVAKATISYDGITFVIKPTGEAYLNNVPISAPTQMPNSCILTLGAPTRSWAERHFITFDASQPEVVF